MEINLTPKQTLAWDLLTDSTTTELGYGGAARGGKTWLGCEFFNFMCLTNPNLKVAIGRRELKNLKRTTLLTLFKVYAHHKMEKDKDYVYNEQKSIITYKNGSQIFLLDLAYQPSDPLYTWLGGFEPDIAWVDESNEIPEIAIQILKSRIGSTFRPNGEAIKPLLLETFNPNKGHIYRRYYKPFKTNTLPEYRKFIKALPTDNPHIPKSYIEELKRAHKITRERLLYGNFDYDDDANNLMSYDNIQDIFTNVGVEDGQKYIVIDVARKGKDKTTIFVWEGWKVIYIKEIAKDTLDNQYTIIEDIREMFSIPKSKVLADEDGLGGGLVDFGGYKGFVANSKPIEKDRLDIDITQKKQGTNYKNLKSQCAFYLANKVNSHKIAVVCDVDPKIKDLIIEDLDSIKMDKIDNDTTLQIITKDKQKEILGRSPDYGDNFIMRAFFDLESEINNEIGFFY
jgi:hypothetical protein